MPAECLLAYLSTFADHAISAATLYKKHEHFHFSIWINEPIPTLIRHSQPVHTLKTCQNHAGAGAGDPADFCRHR